MMLLHYDGYTTGLDDLTRAELEVAFVFALAECERGCWDMEGMSARVEAIRSELAYRSTDDG